MELCACKKEKIRETIKKKSKPVGGCWEWTGILGKHGYGDLRNRTPRTAHRLSYLVFNGPLIPGLVITHDCDNRKCVNPEHLKQQTYQKNSKEMASRGRNPSLFKHRDVCKRGHSLTDPENTLLIGPNKHRSCRTCRREKVIRWRASSRLKRVENRHLSSVENNDSA